MKFFYVAIVIFLMNLSRPSFQQVPPSMSARSYIVLDASNDEVLSSKELYLTRSVASISKIMTAIIAIEDSKLFNVIKVTDEIKEGVGSSIYLNVDDEITIIDLVYGLMLRSGNDAALMIAKNVGGTIEHFVELMNIKAKEIGMNHTTFNNPHGLDIEDEGNISCVYDMALLMSYCIRNDTFVQIAGSKEYRSPLKGLWTNKNKLMHRYPYIIAGKTGFTTKARRTLINAAEKDYQSLIIVTFDCGNDFNEHQTMFEYYFKNTKFIVFLVKGKNEIEDYVFIVDRHIGIRFDKSEIVRGIKVYKINIDTNTLSISIALDSGEVIEGGEYKGIRIEKYSPTYKKSFKANALKLNV